MSAILTVIREKSLRRARLWTELSQVRAEQSRMGERKASVERELHDVKQVHERLSSGAEELCVQRLQWATRRHGHTTQRLSEVNRELDAIGGRVLALEVRASRIGKELEKLEERRLEMAKAAVATRIKHEHNELDDWVLGRRTVNHD